MSGPTAALSTLIIIYFWCCVFFTWQMFWTQGSAAVFMLLLNCIFYNLDCLFRTLPACTFMSLLLLFSSCIVAGWIALWHLLSYYDLMHLSVSCSKLFNWLSPLGICTTLMQMQFMIFQFLAQWLWKVKKPKCALKCRKLFFVMNVLCVITYKSFSVTVMLVNVNVLLCVCKQDHICEACHRLDIGE